MKGGKFTVKGVDLLRGPKGHRWGMAGEGGEEEAHGKARGERGRGGHSSWTGAPEADARRGGAGLS